MGLRRARRYAFSVDNRGHPDFWSTVRPLGSGVQKSFRLSLSTVKASLALDPGIYSAFVSGASPGALVVFRVAASGDASALPEPVSGASSDVSMFSADDRETIAVNGDEFLHARVSVGTATLQLVKVV